ENGGCFIYPDMKSEKWEAPLFAQIALTDKCNLKCWFCYSMSSPDRTLEWDFDELKQLLMFLDKWGVFGVSFGGGEPFLYTRLVEAAEFIKKSTRLDATLTTNGTVATEEQLRQIEGLISEVRVSIRTAKSIENLSMYVNREFDVGVNVILYHDGVEFIRQVIENSLKLGVNDFLINSFRPVGRGANQKNYEPTLSDYRNLAALIKHYRDKATFKTSCRLASYLKRYKIRFMPFVDEKPGRILAISVDKKVRLSSLSSMAYPFERIDEIPRKYFQLTVDGVSAW
ncbi:MAG: radical SAM protein, partial [Candidatus Bathyarchaeia archaeon]